MYVSLIWPREMNEFKPKYLPTNPNLLANGANVCPWDELMDVTYPSQPYVTSFFLKKLSSLKKVLFSLRVGEGKVGIEVGKNNWRLLSVDVDLFDPPTL